VIELGASVETLVELQCAIDLEVRVVAPYISLTASGGAIPKFRFVTAAGSLADAGSPSYSGALVVGVQSTVPPSVPEGDTMFVTYEGAIANPSWSLTPGLAVFLGLQGQPTQDVPVSGWNVMLGMCTGPTTVVLDIRLPVKLRG